jgi:hypothetical protein
MVDHTDIVGTFAYTIDLSSKLAALIAYHLLHSIRYQLKQSDIHASWMDETNRISNTFFYIKKMG